MAILDFSCLNLLMIMIMTSGWGLQQRPTSLIKKYNTLKIKMEIKQCKSYTRVKSKRLIRFTE